MPGQPQRVDVVREDLAELLALLERGDPEERHLRHCSPIVRRLLVDGGGDLPQALSAVGANPDPEVEAGELLAQLPDAPADKIPFMHAGPFRYRGRNGTLRIVISQSEPDMGAGALRTVPLTTYLQAPCVFIFGQTLSRKDLVRYVANKLGGAHLDDSRNRRGDEVFAPLDQLLVQGINDLYPPYLEFGAIVQALVTSPQIMGPFGLRTLVT